MTWERINRGLQDAAYLVCFIPLAAITVLFGVFAIGFAGLAYLTGRFAGISDTGPEHPELFG